jgi:hypothetical protein
MESNSNETVEVCSGEKAWWGDSSAIFSDCVDLACLIDKVSFKYSPREADEVAYELDRNSYETKSTFLIGPMNPLALFYHFSVQQIFYARFSLPGYLRD